MCPSLLLNILALYFRKNGDRSSQRRPSRGTKHAQAQETCTEPRQFLHGCQVPTVPDREHPLLPCPVRLPMQEVSNPFSFRIHRV